MMTDQIDAALAASADGPGFDHRLDLPGSGLTVTIEHDPLTGELSGLGGDGRAYVERLGPGRRRLGELVELVERRVGDSVHRTVDTADQRWEEEYRWNEHGRLQLVDGVEVTRDDEGRIIACRDIDGDDEWLYHYVDGALVRVDDRRTVRHITWDAGHRRVVATRTDGRREVFDYDASGRRREVPGLPATHHRDELGRLWEVIDPSGRVVATYLWDRYMCLGRIDGPLGDPLAAAFLLDPTATPVRTVTGSGATRLPRDAFGERLLGEVGVPGLFGGTVSGSMVHLPCRVLDPRTGSFCSPDPYTGGQTDPRRSAGYDGVLPTEVDRAGSYAACRFDPVGRPDPTGAFTGLGGSAALIISDLTWSLQNNLVVFFGVDWLFNFAMSLVTGFQLGDFGSTEGLGSDRLGSFGLRRDGFVAWLTTEPAATGDGRVGRAFTTQHIVWSPAKDFDELAEARVLDPRGRFEPTLYGTLLVGRPDDGPAFVLRGMAQPGGVDPAEQARPWSRSGGPAVPATPGAVVPKFPSGGFHIDDTSSNPNNPGTLLGVRGPQDCRFVEVEVGDRVGTASVDSDVFTVTAPGTTVTAGGMALFSDVDGDLALVSISAAAGGLLVVTEDLTAMDVGATVTPVDQPALSSETHDRVAARDDAFSAIGASSPYAIADLVRIDGVDGVATTARVSAFETRLPLDRPLPATMGSPLQVRLGAPGAGLEIEIVAADELSFTGGGLPLGNHGLVRAGGGILAVSLTGTTTGGNRTVDADLTTVAALGETAQFHPLSAGATIGTRNDAPEAAAELTYTPNALVSAPDGSTAEVVLRIDDGTNVAVRTVPGAPIHNAVVVDRPIGGTAPLTVERWRTTPGATPVPLTVVATSTRIVVEPADLIDGDTAMVQLSLVTGDPPAAPSTLYAGSIVNGAELTTTQPAVLGQNRPRPGDIVIIDPGGTDEVIAVKEVRVTATFDRSLAGAGGAMTAVPLTTDPNGPTWPVARLAADRIRVLPQAVRTADVAPVEFPRFAVGETLQVSWQSGTPAVSRTSEYRVGVVDGLTIDLETGLDLDADASGIEVQRLVPADPGTGSELLGRDGRLDNTSSDRVDFAVWQPDDLPNGTLVGVAVDENTTVPARVTNVTQDVRVVLTRAPAASGPVEIGIPNVLSTRYSARFLADGGTWLFEDITGPGLTSDQPATLLVVPYVETDRSVTGEIGAGTLIVPEDEDYELDRRQSLVDHELRHTQQYSWFGPLWFNWFPLWAIELGLDLGDDDLDTPSYGPFFEATIAPHSSEKRWHCTFDSATEADQFAPGDRVQVVRGGQFIETTVKKNKQQDPPAEVRMVKDESDDDSPMPTGRVMLRKMNSHPFWDFMLSFTRATTHGGLLSWGFGNTWGRLLWLLSKGVYGIHRAVAGPGDLHPVTYDGDARDRLLLSTDEGIEAMRGATVVIVRVGEDSVVRGATRPEATVLVLDEALPFETDADLLVAPFDAHDPGSYFDWLDYLPAEVPDPADATVIVVDRLGASESEFAEDDRVEVLFRDTSMRMDVISVTEDAPATGQDTVALSQPVPVGTDGEISLRIAKLGSRDPMHSLDSTILTDAGLNWLRYVLDPYGQISQLGDPEPGGFWDVIARTARYGLGTRSWSLFPALGYVFWLRLFREANAHRTFIEQEASEQSGDLYSATGRLFGQVEDDDGFAHKRMTVGDIARYWYWPVDRYANLVTTANLAAPGTNLDADELRLLANRIPAIRNVAAVSDTTVLDGARVVPDLFGLKSPTDPGDISTIANPAGVVPSSRGLIPMSPTMQRTMGCYVAWTRPGDHRAVTRDGIRTGDAQDLHDQAGKRQTLFFDVTVDDVVVTVAGQPVAEADQVTMVLLQSVTVEVSPGSSRVYAVTVSEPSGPVLQAPGINRLTTGSTTTGGGGPEPVEISRFYEARAGGYSGGLDRHGLHLGGDVHIPVRQFTVEVVDTVPMRADPDPTSGAAALSQGGTGVVLVPAPIVSPLTLVTIDGRTPRATDPEITIESPASWPVDTIRFLGVGGAGFLVTVAGSPTLSGPVEAVFDVSVGAIGGPQATLTCRTTINP